MIERTDITEIGKFHKTHGLKGELNAVLDIDATFIDKERPLILDMDGIFVPFYADSVRPKGHFSSLVKLHGVDDESAARTFVNKAVYALKTDVKDFDEECAGEEDDTEGGYAEDFIGYKVTDVTDGEPRLIGEITDVDTQTQNALFIIETVNGDTAYIPVAEEFIAGIDDDSHTLNVTLPPGLLDLNI